MPANRSQLVTFQRVVLTSWDVACWGLALLVLMIGRYNFRFPEPSQWRLALMYLVGAIVLQVVIGVLTKLYRGRHEIASFEEVANLALLVIGIGLVLGIPFTMLERNFPNGIAMTVPLGALVLMLAGRFLFRALQRTSSGQVETEPVLIYGAGPAGQQLARMVYYDPDSPYQVVGFIDDDPAKRNLHLYKTKVRGGRTDLVGVAAKLGVQTVIMAVNTAPRSFTRAVANLTERHGLKMLVMPPVRDMIGGKASLDQLHEVDVADLLGRSQVKTDLGAISGYLTGKVVLVTGAGGSIGSEIAKQVHRFNPSELVMLDRDESGLHGTQLAIYNQGLLDTPNMVLCDIRDRAALDRVFVDHKPDVVFHTAALKHLPLLEQYPLEGWKTNVQGTLNLLRAAQTHGVSTFVNISTDKAADPTSILGTTKRVAEELTAWFAGHQEGKYLSVRFGNVLGSRGSMLHTFTSQIRAGGPVTVTHPDITRYFMTIPEACELVIQAGAVGKAGEVCVLDMGEPVKILDVVRSLIARSGKEIEITFTGLRRGEKLHEVLFSEKEDYHETEHQLISQVAVPPLDPAIVDAEAQPTVIRIEELANIRADRSQSGASASSDEKEKQ